GICAKVAQRDRPAHDARLWLHAHGDGDSLAMFVLRVILGLKTCACRSDFRVGLSHIAGIEFLPCPTVSPPHHENVTQLLPGADIVGGKSVAHETQAGQRAALALHQKSRLAGGSAPCSFCATFGRPQYSGGRQSWKSSTGHYGRGSQ